MNTSLITEKQQQILQIYFWNPHTILHYPTLSYTILHYPTLSYTLLQKNFKMINDQFCFRFYKLKLAIWMKNNIFIDEYILNYEKQQQILQIYFWNDHTPPTLSYTILHYPTLSYTILHYPTLSYTILHYPTLSYTILHYPTLSYTILHYPTLSYTILHYPTLSYTILHYPTLSYTLLQKNFKMINDQFCFRFYKLKLAIWMKNNIFIDEYILN